MTVEVMLEQHWGVTGRLIFLSHPAASPVNSFTVKPQTSLFYWRYKFDCSRGTKRTLVMAADIISSPPSHVLTVI